jgi:hypothetical protein
MMPLKWHAIIVVALLLLPVTACSQPESQPEQQFSYLCCEMEKYIEQAQAIASDLENFNWNQFVDIGVLCPPEGVCPVVSLPIVEKKTVTGESLERWVPLVERLPFPETAKTYSVQCASCLKLASEVCSNSPYNESKTRTTETEELTLAQWQDLCSQLQSALQGAGYLVSRNMTVFSDYTLPQLLVYFDSSDEVVKQKYFNRFMAKSDKYIQLHAELINNIQQAEQLSSDLANWQSSSQITEEQ